MNFKNKLLSKSNQYNFYKENYEKLLKENEELKERIKFISYQNRIKKNAGSFCDWNYIDYFYREDFGDKLSEMLKDLPEESQNFFRFAYLRAIAVNFMKRDTLFNNFEVEEQNRFSKFELECMSENKILNYEFVDNNFNIHCFANDPFNDKDKKFLKDKDIIDAGAYTGDSSISLSNLTSSNVYAFEPFQESYEKLVQNIKLNNINNIVPVQASLSDKNGIMELYVSGDNYQGITSDSHRREFDNSFSIQSMTIDSYVEENNLNVGLIKVDVEGEEKNLLKGAINTLKTQKPILFLSIYHSVDAFFDIKPWIDHLDLGYKFILSKEQPWTFIADTILECRAYD